MKRKIILFAIASASLFIFTGCSNSQAQALTTLENQVKRVESIVANSSNDDISSVSPNIELNSQNYNTINSHRANSYQNMTRENQLKQAVLNLSATIKTCINDSLKLSKSKIQALKTLSSNISSNISKFNETKSHIKNSVKSIKENLKLQKINIIGAESDYISLNGNMNERFVYLCNIYDNLQQAYIIICENTQNSSVLAPLSPSNEVQESDQETNRNSRFKKNIDSYLPNDTEIKYDENIDDKGGSTNNKNIDSFINQKPPEINGYYNSPYGYGYNMPLNNGYNAYAYNNGYGYTNGFRRFNPGRNTDTFYPYNRNIDTYRTYPPVNYPIETNPIQEKKEFKNPYVINTTPKEENTLSELPKLAKEFVQEIWNKDNIRDIENFANDNNKEVKIQTTKNNSEKDEYKNGVISIEDVIVESPKIKTKALLEDLTAKETETEETITKTEMK